MSIKSRSRLKALRAKNESVKSRIARIRNLREEYDQEEIAPVAELSDDAAAVEQKVTDLVNQEIADVLATKTVEYSDGVVTVDINMKDDGSDLVVPVSEVEEVIADETGLDAVVEVIPSEEGENTLTVTFESVRGFSRKRLAESVRSYSRNPRRVNRFRRIGK